MSEFRAALQEVIMAGEACTKDDDIYNAVRYNRAMSAAKALLARPEPRITFGQECGTSYEVVPAEKLARPEPDTDNSELASQVRESVEWLANNAKGMSLLNWDAHSNVILRAAHALDAVEIARPEPEPRITREEAMRLLDNLQTAYARMMYQKAHLGEQYDDAREACLAAMLRPEPDDICCLGFKAANECRCHREEQASAEKAGEYRETGWLVENGMPSDIKYRFMDDDGPQWTRDPLKAIRFARRADAEMFAAGDDDAWRIVEHVFVSPPAASDGEKM